MVGQDHLRLNLSDWVITEWWRMSSVHSLINFKAKMALEIPLLMGIGKAPASILMDERLQIPIHGS